MNVIYNFNTNPRSGKTYYEENLNWKHLKFRIKQLLDDKQSSREYKIDMIICLLESYKYNYYRKKELKNGTKNNNREI